MENNKDENTVQLVGKLIALKQIWAKDGQRIHEGSIEIIRESGTIDVIPILLNSLDDINVGSFISIMG